MQTGKLLLRHRRVHAVEAEGGHPHALHDDGAGQHVGAAGGAALLVAVAGHQDGPAAARLPDAQHRRPGLGHGHDALHQEQVHPRPLQGGGLLGVEAHQHLEGGLSIGRDGVERGAQIPGHQSAACRRLPGQAGQAGIVLLHPVGQSEFLQGAPIGPQGRSHQHLGARLHIGALELQQGLRVLQGPLLGTGAQGHAAFLQLGTGGAVHQKRQG